MHGLIPIRLCDVPENVRAAAARREIRKNPDEAHELLFAVVKPSERTYWLPARCEAMVSQLCRPVLEEAA